MFLKLDWGIIWPIVNIVVFYLLLRKFLFGPVSEVMEKRKKMISSDLDDAAQTKAEA
ncbi:MAG: ATP synthase F0 subunit B, partial [Firmicutes bacterium]|nr:ATP synthase F0 subunit B [Bacillota bacterium]